MKFTPSQQIWAEKSLFGWILKLNELHDSQGPFWLLRQGPLCIAQPIAMPMPLIEAFLLFNINVIERNIDYIQCILNVSVVCTLSLLCNNTLSASTMHSCICTQICFSGELACSQINPFEKNCLNALAHFSGSKCEHVTWQDFDIFFLYKHI